jgi:uncharacterized RDD family membrane protein YckC
MNYPEWWQRFVAAIIDGVIMAVVIFIINAVFSAIAGWDLGALRIMLFIAAIVNTALIVGYKVFFESGTWQATPGKMVFGLQVVDDAGARLSVQRAFMRTWPWWLNLLNIVGGLLLTNIIGLLVALAIIGIFFTFFMDPLGRCIHDQTAGAHVVKTGKGMVNA